MLLILRANVLTHLKLEQAALQVGRDEHPVVVTGLAVKYSDNSY